MSDLSPDSRAFLDEFLAEDEPTPDELETRRLAVLANLGMPASPDPGAVGDSGGSSVEPVASQAGAGVGLGTKALVATAAIVVATATTFALLRPRPSPEPPPQTVATAPAMPRTPSVEPAPATLPPVEVAAPVPTVAVRPRLDVPRRDEGHVERETTEPAIPDAPVPESARTEATDSLSEESMLVAAAEAQLRAGHAAEALSLYDRALARHPTGALRLEAASGRIAALCRAGRLDDGRRELGRFVASYPRSPSGPRLRTLCGVEP